MAEGQDQSPGWSVLDQLPKPRLESARKDDGVGLTFPERELAHEDPEWFQRDLDQPIEDPDDEQPHPLPTERHYRVPGM